MLTTQAWAQSESRQADLQSLSQAIAEHRNDVSEFRIIREAAQELGLRVWLFGGTAAGYAHYVKWDLARLAGDSRYIESRFDYDFTNIYRSTQDADLVVDGSDQDIDRLENLIRNKLSHLQGSKDDWEVRSLREDRGQKLALLNNPDFLNQHTDSNSTGMIELTDPPAGEGIVRDLRDWDNAVSPQFLRDVAEGKLHFYFSPTHAKTTLFKQGSNPPIFSVIRYFTKAFQYELEMRDEDLALIQRIIDGFNAKKDLTTHYAQTRFEKIGSRLVLHASNIEFALDTLDRVGLRKKLIGASTPQGIGTMGWWLNKEPLRTKPLGRGKGRTLKQVLERLGIPIEDAVFAHETSDFLAWESITRDTTGRPNVLISRDDAPGEAAVYGNGHYTRLGRIGARGTGFTIRYRARMDAREGTDFTVANGDYFIWNNRAALNVIPETLNLGWREYFNLLASGETFDGNDLGILEKLKKRLSRIDIPQEAEAEIADLVRRTLNRNIKNLRKQNWREHATLSVFGPLVVEWFKLPVSAKYPELLKRLIRLDWTTIDSEIANSILSLPHWRQHPDLVRLLIKKQNADQEIATEILSQKGWEKHPDLLFLLIQNDLATDNILQNVFTQPHWQGHPELLKLMIAKKSISATDLSDLFEASPGFATPEIIESYFAHADEDSIDDLIERVLVDPRWLAHPQLVERLVQTGKHDATLITFLFNLPGWRERRDLIDQIFKRGDADREIGLHLLPDPLFSDRPDMVAKLIERGKVDEELARHVFNEDHWTNHPELLRRLIQKGTVTHLVVNYSLSNPGWAKHPDIVLDLMNTGEWDYALIKAVLHREAWTAHPHLIQRLILRGGVDRALAEHLLSKDHWSDRPEIVETLLQRGSADREIAIHVLSKSAWSKHAGLLWNLLLTRSADYEIVKFALTQTHWSRYPAMIEFLIRRGSVDAVIAKELLKLDHWKNHPKLRAACGDADPTVARLRQAFIEGTTFLPKHLQGKLCDDLLRPLRLPSQLTKQKQNGAKHWEITEPPAESP